MSKDATKNDETQQDTEESGLSPKQATALAELVQGGSVADVAKAAGVDRSTIYRWKQSDLFRAEYNRHRFQLCEVVQSRLMQLADSAVSIVQQALEDRDDRVALSVLKGLSALSGKPIGSVGADREEIEAALKLHRGFHKGLKEWNQQRGNEENDDESDL